MSGEGNAKPVSVDPQCIQEALRMYLQPIKNDDPKLDFYTMYKRETMEYDTEYMQKYNEDLNTTLIFAGLFSAVSSTFITAIQPKLEPDSGQRSEAYLRAILLTLNRSIIPDEVPTAPPAWSGSPAEIITTSDLLYASLLMSLLAALVAMLGKQWLNRYLRHTGGSMVERCGDRQRKFNGLENWPFRLFIESLPVMLQIALLLLACALSRYMWSINVSVASVIISFTVLGVAFYFGIVVAGTSSYECPFQTPASRALRYLRENMTTWNPLATLPRVSAITLTSLPVSPTTLANLTLPSIVSLAYAILVDARLVLVSAFYRVRDIIRSPLSWEISASHITSGIYSMTTKVGHYTIILLLRADRAFGNAKHKLAQGVRRSRRSVVLPVTTEDVQHQPSGRQNSMGLRIGVRNLEILRKQNADNALCVCWILRNITDPEAIDSAICLAGIIRWFDGDSNPDPPLDLIVSAFEACFDSTGQVYPSVRDRAYYSARAILQINRDARLRSQEHASNYPIPVVPLLSSLQPDPDLSHILHTLEGNSSRKRPSLLFPNAGTNSHIHLLWVSNLFVDLALVGPNPILHYYPGYLSAAYSDHQAVIANTLLVWYLLLGGHVEEGKLWAIDKSDAFDGIFSCLSTRVMDVITGGECLIHLEFLLEFLAAWEKRPARLTPIAYRWCSVISEAAGTLGQREISTPSESPRPLDDDDRDQRQRMQHVRLRLRRMYRERRTLIRRERRQDLLLTSPNTEKEFTEAGPGCDPVRLGDTSDRSRGRYLLTADYADILFVILEIGFRLAPPFGYPTLHMNHRPHHDWLFETALSSDDDEVVADATCAWMAGGETTPPGSFVRFAAKRIKKGRPFSPRLRREIKRVVARTWRHELGVSPLETVQLLNHLNLCMDDMGERPRETWAEALVDAICSPTGLENLSPHYWRVLDELGGASGMGVGFGFYGKDFEYFDAVTKSFEEAEDWEKLEVWMLIKWGSLQLSESAEDAGRATLKLLLRRPSALLRFTESIRVLGTSIKHCAELQRICDRVRGEQPPQESPPRSIHALPGPLVPFPFVGDDTF